MNSLLHNEDTRFLELLRKWQSGDFTRADEQELNTLAAADPFRREALEGMMESPEFDHSAALNALQQKIREKSRRRIALPQIWALAAALVLILGAVWFFNIRPIPTGTGQIAQEIPAPTEQPQITPTPAPEPSLSPKTALPERSATTQAPISRALDKDVVMSDPRKETPALEEQEAAGQANDIAVADDQRNQTTQKPGAVAVQSTNTPRQEEIAKQAAGARAKKSMESAPPAPAPIEEKADKKKAAKTASTTAQPLIGWEQFRRYLSANARLTPEARAHNITGTVRLQFQLDNSNQPTDFKIISSIGYGCDEAAINLVKNTTWVGGDGQPITVDVPFVR